MKITITDAFALEMVYNGMKERPMPIKTAYKFSKLIKLIQADLDFYREQLKKIIEDCAEKDENGEYAIDETGSSVQIKQDKLEECQTRMNELQNIELNIDFDNKFDLDELDHLGLTLQDLQAFMPFVVD